MGKQLGFLIDRDACVGCRNCEIACLNNHSWGVPFRHLREIYKNDNGELVYLKISYGCNHCEDPECIKACPEKSFYKKTNGIVLHELEKCNGCGDCIRACPYDAPQYNSDLGIVDKCDMCVELLEQGEESYCVNICATNAIEIVDLKQLDEDSLSKTSLGFETNMLTRPAIRFRLPKPQKQILIDDK